VPSFRGLSRLLKLSFTVPDNVRELLCARYEYIAAEKEIIPTLTGDIRVCDACGEWCPQ
jgi:epoxyqueuosine reductase QueG